MSTCESSLRVGFNPKPVCIVWYHAYAVGSKNAGTQCIVMGQNNLLDLQTYKTLETVYPDSDN